MLYRFISLAFRNLRRNLLYSTIVIGGLVLGITTFLAIIQWTAWHKSFDRHFPQSDHIYRLTLKEQRENFERQTARIIHGDIVNQLYTTYKVTGIDSLARLAPFRNAIVRKDNIVFYEDRSYACDPEFLRLFPPEMIVGDPSKVLADPYKVILSLETARKYFGDENPVGKTLEIFHQFSYESDIYEITGIFNSYPGNTHFKIDLLTSFDNPQTYNSTAWTYLQLKPGVEPGTVEHRLKELIDENNDAEYAEGIQPVLMPLEDIHLHSHLARELDQNVHKLTLLILLIAGMLVFILAWFNFTLLSISQNQLNIKKLIYQWQLGAGKRTFFYQFLIEFLTVGFISFLLAVLFSFLVSEPVRNTFQVPLTQNLEILTFSLLSVLVLLLVSAVFTAAYATQRLYRILRIRYFSARTNSTRHMNARNWFIRAVIITEFIITFILITNLLVIREQVNYSIARQIGSNDTTTLQIPNLPRPVIDGYATFRDELLRYPAIKEVTAMMEEPGGMAMDAFTYRIEGLPETSDRLYVFPVDENFIRFYDLEILAGRDFPEHYNTNDTTEFFMLNETAARLHDVDDYQELIGKNIDLNFSIDGFIYPGEITGVVEDFHLSDMEREISPMIIFPEYTWLYCFSVRLAGTPEQGLEILRKEWKEFFPDYPLRYYFTTDLYRELYSTELSILRVLIAFSLITLLIAGTGLFALSGFFMHRKMHAAAIRKISGAGMYSIIRPELGQYLVLALISSVIAFPVSWFAIGRWQANFVYQAPLPFWVFPAVSGFLILFSWIAVLYHSLRLARLNPAEFIRSE